MASAIIHICVAKKVNEKYGFNEKELFLGTIAPDLAKQIGENKIISHFITNERDIPNIDLFLDKYGDSINNAFEFGYLVHLLTDKYWFDGFVDELTVGNSIKTLDGTIVPMNEEEIGKIIYQDYTNLNIQLIENYDLDLSLFYEEFNDIDTVIDVLDFSKLDVLIDKMGLIVMNSKKEKDYIFDIYMINDFINSSVEKIFNEIDKIKGENNENNS